MEEDLPGRYWFGEKPEPLVSHRGEGVDALIDQVESAAKSCPWPNTYKVFPGPDSNTFTAWIAQEAPALNLDLLFSVTGSGYPD